MSALPMAPSGPAALSEAELVLDVGAEEHVRAEEDLGVLAAGLVDVADDSHRVGGGAAVIGERLDLG